jgi:hypothetical protein
MKKWLIVVAVLLLAVRIALPYVIRDRVNKTLATMPEYTGQVDRVHLALLRGAVVLKDLKIKHKKNDFSLVIPDLDMDVSWLQLIKKHLVADVYVMSPRFRVLVPKPLKAAEKAKEKAKAVEKTVEAKTGKSLPDTLADMMPFNVANFHLNDGTIRIQQIDSDIDKKAEKDKDADEGNEQEEALEARATHLQVDVQNLTNSAKLAGTSTATGKVTAKIMKEGDLKLDLKLNPTAEHPTFDVNMALTQVNLVELNPLFRWQWDIDLTRGYFAMFMEAAAKDGGFKGYVKPFLHDLRVTGSKKDEDKKLGAKLKEAVVEVVAGLMENDKTENVATRVPFEGKFEDPAVGVWQAVLTVLRNAFVKALSPRLDRSVGVS